MSNVSGKVPGIFWEARTTWLKRSGVRAGSELIESGGFPNRLKSDSSFLPERRPAGMSKALSIDLRQRVVAAVRDERLSHRAAAARFKVSAANISRWRALERHSGHLGPGPLGGDPRRFA